MSLEEEAAELLEKAADGFESGRYGWMQGNAHGWDPEMGHTYCSVGALYHEAGLYAHRSMHREGAHNLYVAAEQQLARTLGVFGKGLSCADIPKWNDLPGRKVEEVIDKMKEAAKELRNRA